MAKSVMFCGQLGVSLKCRRAFRGPTGPGWYSFASYHRRDVRIREIVTRALWFIAEVGYDAPVDRPLRAPMREAV